MRLPSSEALGLPAGSAVAVPVPAGGMTLYRLLRGSTPRLEDFEPHWTRPQAQLRRIPDLFRTSVSHWLELDQAAKRSTTRVAYVARVELAPDPLIRVALTEHLGGRREAGHVDVWAYPRQLLSVVAGVART